MSAPPSRGTLAVLFTGVLVGALDIAIVGPALPSIQATFGVDTRTLQWVFSIYILVGLIAAPLVAKLSDRHSRRAVYAACLALFGAGSLLVSGAPDFTWLLAGRAIQAVGAGGLLPVAGAVVADAFPVERRGRVLGLIGAVYGVAFVIGPLVGGVFLSAGWRWLFLVNLPLVAVLVPASLKLLPRGVSGRRRSFDWIGATVLGVGLIALVWGLGQIDVDRDWVSLAGRCLPFLVMAGIAAVALWFVEMQARDPIIDPKLLRSRQLRLVGIVALATGIVEAGMVFLPSLSVLAFAVSPSTASFMLLPLVVALIIGSPTAGRLLDRFGAKPVIQGGLGLTAVGLLVLAQRPLELWTFYTGAFCVGLGLAGLLGAPLRFIALEEAGEEHRGASQGLLTVFLSTGRMIGAAVIGGVVTTGPSELEGFRHALSVLAVVALAGALAATSMRARRAPS
ncbi:MAG TPA: MFS transporter [Gammaproteobacteria bacterium]